MIIEREGNIFTTKSQTIVNTVNCIGVMGAGIAYEFRLRHKSMYEKYVYLCENKKIDIGKLWIYKIKDENTLTHYSKVLNFPTKVHWRYPTKEEYLHKGLKKFIKEYKKREIESVAFPILGASKGGLSETKSLKIMESYLSKCDIDIEIWHFDPYAKDDLYEKFVAIIQNLKFETILKETSIRKDILLKVIDAINNRKDINSISALLKVNGIGDKTLESLFNYIMNFKEDIHLFNYKTKE